MVAVMVATNGAMAGTSVMWVLGVVIVLAAYWNQIVAKISAWKHGRLVMAAVTATFAAVFIADVWGVCGGRYGWLFCGF